MSELTTSLFERREEFGVHMSLAFAMENQILSGEASMGSTTLSARHLLTMKSGLIVHLYNIVEAVMTKAIRAIGRAISQVSPRRWNENALREWLRKNAPFSLEGTEDTRLDIVHKASLALLNENIASLMELKKPSGTWSDKVIYRFMQRLGCEFPLPPDMHRRIASSPIYGDQTPLEFLADRRNAIAHGRRSFEGGASDLTLSSIEELSKVTLDYLSHAISAFDVFLNDKAYLVQGEQ